jgi:hypothetical protein
MLEKELASSELQAIIEITDSDSFENKSDLYSHSKALVHKIIKGSRDVPKEIVIETLGGEKRGLGLFYSGFPRPYIGEKYQASLKKVGDTYRVVGLEKGFVNLNPTRNYSRNRTDGSNGAGTGAYLYWASSSIPIPYFISYPTFKNLTSFTAAIHASFKTWRSVANTTIDFIGMGCTKTTQNDNDGVNSVVYIQSNWIYDTSIIALTRNFYVAADTSKQGLILDTDILLNAVNHSFTTTAESGKHDVQNILTHEIGHWIGLGHEVAPTDTTATMYATASAGELNKRYLHDNDIAAVRAAYPGSGLKGDYIYTPCNVEVRGLSCAANHEEGFRKPNLWILLGVLISWLLLRVYVRRKFR